MKISKKHYEEIWFSTKRYKRTSQKKSEFYYINRGNNHILDRKIGPSRIEYANNNGTIIYQWYSDYYEIRKDGPAYIRIGGAKFFTFYKNIDCLEEEFWNA